jgi:hypothetical protein
VQVPPLLFFWRSSCRLPVGSPGFYVLDFILKPVTDVELSKEVLTSKVRWMPLIGEWNASANMFYLLKNLLLLSLVIFKLKCNNLILNEIRVLNASYVCLHVFSLHRESPDLDPERRTPHLWGGSVIAGIRAKLGLNTHSKHIKIATTLAVRMFSPYKDHSSVLRWQANYVYILHLHLTQDWLAPTF